MLAVAPPSQWAAAGRRRSATRSSSTTASTRQLTTRSSRRSRSRPGSRSRCAPNERPRPRRPDPPGRSGASPADVFFTENSPELATLAQRGLLSKLRRYDARGGAETRPARRPGTGSRSRCGRQPRLRPDARSAASQLPQSILDLAKPQWKGKVAIAPTDSDFPPVVGAVIARYGEAARPSVARRPEAQRADVPGRGGGRRGGQQRRRRRRRDQPVLLVPPAARARRRTACTASSTTSRRGTQARS